jgi:UDP-glucose 4-epimerase
MRVLITGGFGFVGARLGVHLHHQGHQVVLASRTESCPPDWLPEAHVVRIDWHDSGSLESSCRGVDVVVHASGMNAQDCASDPVDALEVNGVATARLVAAAAKAEVNRFVYLSTAHVYDSPLSGEVTENSCPRNLHPYATSHRAGEDAVLYLAQQGKIDGVVVRLSNAFGRPVHPQTNCWTLLVNDLCREAVQNGFLLLRSSGRQLRDFVPLSDVCLLLEGIVTRVVEGAAERLHNLGAARSLSVMEMATKIQERCAIMLGDKPEIRMPADTAASETLAPLSFSCRNLGGDAAAFDRRVCAEIDALLLACRDWYGLTRKKEV